MQIEPTLARLVWLSFGLSRYFRLSESLSEITSLFDFSRYLDRSLGSLKVSAKV